MRKILILLVLPILGFSQNIGGLNNDSFYNDPQVIGCVDLDETLVDLVSIFGDTSFLDGLLGCAELIPTLESGILSAFLPFDIPLDCNTDLTPFGYLDMDLSDVCECSCQDYLSIPDLDISSRMVIENMSILGQASNLSNFSIDIYSDGSVKKKLVIKQ
tara:strand:+ start:2684 stop:3160 length:477 start_codon:yes stop_codon:yes gene_type:complete